MQLSTIQNGHPAMLSTVCLAQSARQQSGRLTEQPRCQIRFEKPDLHDQVALRMHCSSCLQLLLATTSVSNTAQLFMCASEHCYIYNMLAVVPPGHALVGGVVTPCSQDPGQYKSGWGDTPCIACGSNILAKRSTDLIWAAYASSTADTLTNQTTKVSTSSSECCKYAVNVLMRLQRAQASIRGLTCCWARRGSL